MKIKDKPKKKKARKIMEDVLDKPSMRFPQLNKHMTLRAIHGFGGVARG